MDNSVLRVSYQSILQQGKKLTLYRPDGTSQVLKSANPDKDYGEYWEQLIFIGTVPDSAINEIESIVIPPERQELFSPKEKKVNYRNCIHLSLIAAEELGKNELANARANARKHEARRRKIEDDELINGFSEYSINPGFEYTAYIKTMEVLDGILSSSPNSADPATPSQLQENEVDEADGDWVRADVWAGENSDGSKMKKGTILKRLSKAREKSVNTHRQYKGYDIYKDKYEQEYYEVDGKVRIYKRSHLKKNSEILIQ